MSRTEPPLAAFGYPFPHQPRKPEEARHVVVRGGTANDSLGTSRFIRTDRPAGKHGAFSGYKQDPPHLPRRRRRRWYAAATDRRRGLQQTDGAKPRESANPRVPNSFGPRNGRALRTPQRALEEEDSPRADSETGVADRHYSASGHCSSRCSRNSEALCCCAAGGCQFA